MDYPARFARIVTASGAELFETDEEPGRWGAPWGAKSLVLVMIDGEAWVRIDPWPEWGGPFPWFERAGSLQSFYPCAEVVSLGY